MDTAGGKSGPQCGVVPKHSGLGRSSLVSVHLFRLILSLSLGSLSSFQEAKAFKIRNTLESFYLGTGEYSAPGNKRLAFKLGRGWQQGVTAFDHRKP
jgi:hypothetical protein